MGAEEQSRSLIRASTAFFSNFFFLVPISSFQSQRLAPPPRAQISPLRLSLCVLGASPSRLQPHRAIVSFSLPLGSGGEEWRFVLQKKAHDLYMPSPQSSLPIARRLHRTALPPSIHLPSQMRLPRASILNQNLVYLSLPSSDVHHTLICSSVSDLSLPKGGTRTRTRTATVTHPKDSVAGLPFSQPALPNETRLNPAQRNTASTSTEAVIRHILALLLLDFLISFSTLHID